MFLEGGAEEIMIVAVAALVFVKPKDLPVVLRKVGQFTARMRGLAAEFRASFDEMARQSELDELRQEVQALRRGDLMKPIRREIDDHFESLHREFGAPPPIGFGERDGEILPGPDAAHALPAPEIEPASPEAASPPQHAPPPPSEPHGGS